MGRCSSISESEQQAVESVLLRSNMPRRNLAMFVLGVETGLRISELLSITIGDVIDTERRVKGTLAIQKGHCKGKVKARRVALSPRARDAIYGAVEEAFGLCKSHRDRHLFSPGYRLGAITRRQAYGIISSALREAGITHTHGTHTMRKTRAERVARCLERKHNAGETSTVSIMAVMHALGHADIKTTQRYLSKGAEEVDRWTAAGEI